MINGLSYESQFANLEMLVSTTVNQLGNNYIVNEAGVTWDIPLDLL
jgi:hypothetical protein